MKKFNQSELIGVSGMLIVIWRYKIICEIEKKIEILIGLTPFEIKILG